jgi:hypothetical protein
MLEDRSVQHDKVVVDKYHDPNATYHMTTRDYVLRPSANPISGPIVMYLPPVAEAKGRFYSIIARQADALNSITITHNDDSECWAADVILNGKCDRALFYSDGLAWLPCTTGPGRWPGAATTPAPGTTQAPTTAPATTQTTGVPTTSPV